MSLLGHARFGSQILFWLLVSSQGPEEFVSRFAEVVRAERMRVGLSQRKLAELAGVARTGVVTLEQGKRVPTIYVAKALASALGCELSELVGIAERQGRKRKSKGEP